MPGLWGEIMSAIMLHAWLVLLRNIMSWDLSFRVKDFVLPQCLMPGILIENIVIMHYVMSSGSQLYIHQETFRQNHFLD